MLAMFPTFQTSVYLTALTFQRTNRDSDSHLSMNLRALKLFILTINNN